MGWVRGTGQEGEREGGVFGLGLDEWVGVYHVYQEEKACQEEGTACAKTAP